jgi:hypothetical protein
MQHPLPIFYRFNQVFTGSGFIAGVSIKGRALIEFEGSEVWVTSITPAGFAGGGQDRQAALNDFQLGWAHILEDFAQEAVSFADFDARCQEFFASEAPHVYALWDEALQRVRAENHQDPELKSIKAELFEAAMQVTELTPAHALPSVTPRESVQAAA